MSEPSLQSTPELPTPLKAIRIELVTTAVNFLNDPQVKSAPLSKRLAFLEGKGLTQEEIDLAIIKSNSNETWFLDSIIYFFLDGIANNQNNQSTNIPLAQSQYTAQTQTQTRMKSSGYKGLLLTTAIVLGTGSLLVSNYQSIKVTCSKSRVPY